MLKDQSGASVSAGLKLLLLGESSRPDSQGLSVHSLPPSAATGLAAGARKQQDVGRPIRRRGGGGGNGRGGAPATQQAAAGRVLPVLQDAPGRGARSARGTGAPAPDPGLLAIDWVVIRIGSPFGHWDRLRVEVPAPLWTEAPRHFASELNELTAFGHLHQHPSNLQALPHLFGERLPRLAVTWSLASHGPSNVDAQP